MFNLLKKVQLNEKLQALDANFDKLYFVNRSNIEKDWKAKKNRNGKIFFIGYKSLTVYGPYLKECIH